VGRSRWVDAIVMGCGFVALVRSVVHYYLVMARCAKSNVNPIIIFCVVWLVVA
jgi:hypothetical protein